MGEFLGKLKDKVKETKDKLTKSPEEITSQKFDEMISKIVESKYSSYRQYSDRYSGQILFRENGNPITLSADKDVDDTGKLYHRISITKMSKEHGFTVYSLKKEKGIFMLEYRYNEDPSSRRNTHREETITNIPPEKILNEILPNFEKRLNEAENYKKQEINNKIKEASLYAQAQDQKEADKLLEGLDNLDSLA